MTSDTTADNTIDHQVTPAGAGQAPLNEADAEEYILPVSIKVVTVDRSGEWLTKGWHDFRKSIGLSLTCGGCFVLLGYILSFGLIEADMGSMVLPLFGGFMLMAPVLAVGFYAVARLIKNNKPVSFSAMWAGCFHNIGQVAAMGVVLLILNFVWVLLAIFLFTIFYGDAPPQIDTFIQDMIFTPRGIMFLLVGSAIGAVLAAAVFAVTAISIPMLLDQDVDVITAMTISVLAVRANARVMVGWAGMLGVLIAFGFITFFIGLAVVFPIAGYATWHAYRDLVIIRKEDRRAIA